MDENVTHPRAVFACRRKIDYSVLVCAELYKKEKVIYIGQFFLYKGTKKELAEKWNKWDFKDTELISFNDIAVFLEYNTEKGMEYFKNKLYECILRAINPELTKEMADELAKQYTFKFDKRTTKQLNEDFKKEVYKKLN